MHCQRPMSWEPFVSIPKEACFVLEACSPTVSADSVLGFPSIGTTLWLPFAFHKFLGLMSLPFSFSHTSDSYSYVSSFFSVFPTSGFYFLIRSLNMQILIQQSLFNASHTSPLVWVKRYHKFSLFKHIFSIQLESLPLGPVSWHSKLSSIELASIMGIVCSSCFILV